MAVQCMGLQYVEPVYLYTTGSTKLLLPMFVSEPIHVHTWLYEDGDLSCPCRFQLRMTSGREPRRCAC